MKRADLDLAIRKATEIIQQDEVLIIGSQSILGSHDETALPTRATMSNEVDIAPLRDDDQESLATRLDVLVGEWSDFDQENGFYIQGVGMGTAILPDGFADRLIRVTPPGSAGSGLCLDPHDLCAAKLARNEQKDRDFVLALIEHELIDPALLLERIDAITDARLGPTKRQIARDLVQGLIA